MLPSDDGWKPRWVGLLLPEVYVRGAEAVLESLVVRVIGRRKRHDIASARREETTEERLVGVVVMIRPGRSSVRVLENYNPHNPVDVSIHGPSVFRSPIAITNSSGRRQKHRIQRVLAGAQPR